MAAIKKGINIWSFDQSLSLETCLKMAKDAGFEGVELALAAKGPLSMESTDEEIIAIREMAEEFGVVYCDTYNDMYGINWLLADGLHPNNAGYRVMASTVFRTLCENVNMAE